MINLQDKNFCPSLEDISKYIRNSVFMQFCLEIKNTYNCAEKIEYSSCCMEKGWNIKFKKSGKTLCTIYPREHFFTVMIVVGAKEKDAVEAVLPNCTPELQKIYRQTREGNGQRWLMIDLEDNDALYKDLLYLIQIRRNNGLPVSVQAEKKTK